MATVASLTQAPSRFLLQPRPGPGVCTYCFNLTRGFSCCYACSRREQHLSALAPISYSVAHEQLHNLLWSYKRLTGQRAEHASLTLSGILWRFLAGHEACLAHQIGVERFDIVTTVPSSNRARDRAHPLRRLVGEHVGPTGARHRRVLRRTEVELTARQFDARRYEAIHALDGLNVLLIDDTWTTGASAQSAAAALRQAGAKEVAAVVIGRHVNRDWHENAQHLDKLANPFDWSSCVLCRDHRSSALAA